MNRYDGGSIKVYRHNPRDPHSLPSSLAAALLEDSKNRLWIGSGWGNAGLALYDRDHDRFERFLPNPGQAHGNDVRAMVEDRSGLLWLGTDNGVARLDPSTGAVTRFPLSPERSTGTPEAVILALCEDRQGRLWVGGHSGLLRFDRRTGKYARWPELGADPAGLGHAEILDFYQGRDRALWVATLGDGLVRLDPATGHETQYLPNPRDPASIGSARVRCLVGDGGGRLYVGTENRGLDVLDLRTRKFAHFRPDPQDDASLSSSSIWSLHRDGQGILWIGTFDGGVSTISPFAQGFQRIRARPGGLSDAHVSAVMEDHLGNLWIGTNGGGLNRLNRRTGTFTYYRHDPQDDTTIGSDAVWALLEDSHHVVWVGGWDGGLGRLDPVSGRVTRFRHDPANPRSLASDHVWRIIELRTGELLVVTQSGADLFDRGTRSFTRLADRYPGADEGVLYSAAEDQEGSIWLAGIGPVARIDRGTGHIERYRNPARDRDGAGVGWTQAVLTDRAGNVWLGTDAGLRCVVPGRRQAKRYTMADGLPSDTITSLTEDAAGNLWIGTTHGLSELLHAIQLAEKATFVNFDVHDGLQGNEFTRNAAFSGGDGEIFFGGPGGLTSFDPQQIRKNEQAPPVVLTDLRLFNRSVGVGTPGSPLTKAITETPELTLSYKDSMVTFEFAALNLVVPQKNQYAYKLEGFDRDWNEVGTRHSATYTNLPDGTFTLRVRGSNNDGVWSDAGVSLVVHVTPPFWREPWFVAAVVLMLVGAALSAHRLRVRRHVRIERELQARVATALADVKTLRGLLPICAWCKNVRDDRGYWSRIEEYVSEHTQAEFSHGICPECRSKMRDGLSRG